MAELPDQQAIIQGDSGKYYTVNAKGEIFGGPYDTVDLARENISVDTVSGVDFNEIAAGTNSTLIETFGDDRSNKQILEEELRALEASTERRTAEAREQRDIDRAEGQARGEELFYEGALGRVDESTPDNIQQLLTERREQMMASQADIDALLARTAQTGDQIVGAQDAERLRRDALNAQAGAGDAAEMARRQSELDRVTQSYDDLIRGRLDPTSPLGRAMEEQGIRGIQEQTQANMAAARAAANAGNLKMIGALEAEAMRAGTQARADLQRDLLIENRLAAEALTGQAVQARNLNLTQMEQLRNVQLDRLNQMQQASEQLQLAHTDQRLKAQQMLGEQQLAGLETQSAAQARLEDMQAAVRQDQLQRQLINLQNKSSEVFGRLSTEEGMVAQGIAERTGIQQAVLSESNLAEQRRHQMEMEEIQRIEAEKPPPSSGGKIVCTELNRQGILDDHTYAGDMEYSKRVSGYTKAGYWFLAQPFVDRMPNSKFVTNLVKWPAICWAREMAYRVNYREKGSIVGKIVSNIGEPICYCVGKILSWVSPKAKKKIQELENQREAA